MDEKDTQDLVAQLICAVDNLQVARQSTVKDEEEAFEILLQIRNDITVAYYA